MQKEQSLITRTSWTEEGLQYALDWAMGYAVYENGTRIEALKGFRQQLLGGEDSEGNFWWGSSQSMRNNYELGRGPNADSLCRAYGDQPKNPSYFGGYCSTFEVTNSTYYYNVSSKQKVKPENKSTMALYRYTPHVFNGNYNFWYYWNQWFRFSFSFNKSKFVQGDVTGDDKEEIVALYNYGNNTTGLWIFEKITDREYNAKRWWLSGKGAWSWENTNLQVGDVNSDGKDDVILTYGYGSSIGIWNFISSGNSISSIRKVYQSGSWNYDNTKFSSGDVTGDGKEDLIAFYNYGKNTAGLWIFERTNTGYRAKRWWLSGKGAWSWENTNLQVGDVTGDNKQDFVLTYNYGSNALGIWNFVSSGNGIVSRIRLFIGYGN